ncbi:hypothetical protein I3842_Q015200 [Carya illinoinensis]|uniref:Uncharacterized protein n=1 Tax=Carya illinoinensis TaxID=32201 RepID=A0A921ZZW8_CARIL|nr:hypothetical protein I3842_Q015200 [Carya illinoinensis]
MLQLRNSFLSIFFSHFLSLHPLVDLANFSRLEILDMDGNRLNGSISPYIGALSSAKAISLSYNYFNGDFPTQGELKKLEEFDISGNDFEGILPQCINNISSLRVLDISSNRFIGNLSSSLVASLNPTTIEYIDISHNLFEGLFSFSLFANHSKLKVVRFISDNNKLVIETKIQWLTGNISKFLFDQHRLEEVDFSHNKLKGSFPFWLLENNTRLQLLNLRNNSFEGQFYLQPEHRIYISWMDIYLDGINIFQNHFECNLSSSIGDMSYLNVLDLPFNRFSGKVATELVSKCTSLETLNLCNNNFQGEIFSKCFKLSALEHSHRNMQMHRNKLTRSIPKALSNSSSLVTLDVRENNLSDTLPVEISNNFSGMIPNQICLLKKIAIMDLSRNSFSGTIPHCFHNITFVKINALILPFPKVIIILGYLRSHGSNYVDIDMPFDNQVEVEFVTKYRSCSYKGGILDYMSRLDLSCNKLTGGIPVELEQLSSIHSLNLPHNQLRDSISDKFSSLASIESLDLSHNSLSGEITSILIDLNFMGTFNVAYNNLSGKVPDIKNQFGTFEKSSYEGNPFLCGPLLENGCSTISEKSNSKASGGKLYEVDPVVFFASFSVSYIIFFSMVASIIYINPYWRQMCFNLIEDIMYWSYFTVLTPQKRLSNRLCRH